MNHIESNIKVSVSLIAYKHAPYIRQCLDSILAQKVNFKYEIVIGDDCSNDGTAEILAEYKEKYPDIIVPIINEENLGASKNGYNVGKACRGEYVAGGEADDFWLDENRLQKQVDYLDAHPDIVAVGTNFAGVDHNGNNPVVAMSKSQVNRRYSLKDYLKNGMILHGNTFLRRNVFPYNDERYIKLKFAEPTMGDIIGRVLLYDKGDIFILPDVTHAHRSGEGNKTSYSYQQKSRAVEYSYMYCRIVDDLTEYFNGKYDLSELKANRTSGVMCSAFFRQSKIDKKEFKEYFRTLPPAIRRMSYVKFVKRLFARLIRKVWRIFHK